MLPCSRNYLFEPSEQYFGEWPVECTLLELMLKIKIYQCILWITVTKRLLSINTVMLLPWKMIKNGTIIYTFQALLQNLLTNAHYLNVLEKVTFYLTKINNYTMPLQKTLAYFSLSTIMTMGMLNPSNKEPIEQGTTTKRKSKGKWRICFRMESSWVSPVVLVRKSDKTSWLYIDYRNLYKTTIKGSYPLLHTQDILDTLHRNDFFMTLDLVNALHQITRLILKKLVVKKQLLPHMLGSSNTCFPFGLTNAPASFQCLQEHVLWDCIDNFIFFYI